MATKAFFTQNLSWLTKPWEIAKYYGENWELNLPSLALYLFQAIYNLFYALDHIPIFSHQRLKDITILFQSGLYRQELKAHQCHHRHWLAAQATRKWRNV